MPIWVGGRTRRSLRRALDLGDGWIPFGLALDEVAPMLAAPVVVDAGRGPPGSTSSSPPNRRSTPSDDPGGAERVVGDYEAAGATALALRFRHTSRAHYLEQLEAMRAVVMATTGVFDAGGRRPRRGLVTSWTRAGRRPSIPDPHLSHWT